VKEIEIEIDHDPRIIRHTAPVRYLFVDVRAGRYCGVVLVQVSPAFHEDCITVSFTENQRAVRVGEIMSYYRCRPKQ
jgi:hypothetical protein